MPWDSMMILNSSDNDDHLAEVYGVKAHSTILFLPRKNACNCRLEGSNFSLSDISFSTDIKLFDPNSLGTRSLT